jgi:hypothetical protein
MINDDANTLYNLKVNNGERTHVLKMLLERRMQMCWLLKVDGGHFD